jgi:hypothetical protein
MASGNFKKRVEFKADLDWPEGFIFSKVPVIFKYPGDFLGEAHALT